MTVDHEKRPMTDDSERSRADRSGDGARQAAGGERARSAG
jgi:hypothetical protein